MVDSPDPGKGPCESASTLDTGQNNTGNFETYIDIQDL